MDGEEEGSTVENSSESAEGKRETFRKDRRVRTPSRPFPVKGNYSL